MKKDQEIWITLLRIASACSVLFLWGLSVKWSAAGLQAKNPDDSSTLMIGYGIAIFISIAQLVFNRGAINPTLFIVGLCAYAYGIGTNLVGISAVFNFDVSVAALQTDPIGWIIDVLILFGLSFTIEVAPEAYAMWAMNPKLQRPGDAISTILDRRNIFSVPKGNQQQKSVQPPFSPRSERTNVPPSVQNVHLPVQERSPISPTERNVFSYIDEHRSRNKGQMPSYSDVVKNTVLTSKSQVRSMFEAYGKRKS